MSSSRKRVADAAFLLAVMFYMLVGTANVPQHGDEYMLIAMARDYFTLRQGQSLAVTPPVQPDTLPYLRIINGTLESQLTGVLMELTGRGVQQLPGIYAWVMPVDWNRAQGNIPPDDLVILARWPSSLLAALGVIPLFLIALRLRLRSVAYPAVLIYALHPAILINGRRAMMEGSLLFFSLLCLFWLIEMIEAEHAANSRSLMHRLPLSARYILLGILLGCVVAAKYTGLVIVGAVFLTLLFITLFRQRSWRPLFHLGLTAIVAGAVWLILNPGYWGNPLATLRATLDARVELLQRQTDPSISQPLSTRLGALLTQPFLTPPQYYEAPTWANVITTAIADYEHGSVDGWSWDVPVGLILTALSMLGLLALVWDARKGDLLAWAILIWTLAVVTYSLLIPVPWQRYYLPLILVAIILAGVGLGRLLVRQTTPDLPARGVEPKPSEG